MINAVIIIGWEPQSTRFRPLSISNPPPLFPSKINNQYVNNKNLISWWLSNYLSSFEGFIQPKRSKECVSYGLL
jgi:hypothetical protein